jgi:hypothetical protein
VVLEVKTTGRVMRTVRSILTSSIPEHFGI